MLEDMGRYPIEGDAGQDGDLSMKLPSPYSLPNVPEYEDLFMG
jgi:hypothetical protein